MNIIKMHLKVKARLDQVSTPRFKDSQIDNAINTVTSYIIRKKIMGTIENGKRVSFQKVQVMRDELYTIIKELDTSGSLSINADNKTIEDLPSDYRYLVALEYQVNGVAKDFSVPITYDERTVLEKDPYMRPSKDFPYNFYHVESSSGLECFYGQVANDVLDYARIMYIADPTTVYKGVSFSTSKSFGVSTQVIADSICVYSGTTYNPGEQFTMTAGTNLTSGTAYYDFVNSDMPNSLQDEICDNAAKVLNMDIENFDKWKAMTEEDMINKK
jgi:hypothetical protein